MDIAKLIDIGLTEAQAKAYIALLTHGRLTPPELAKLTGETRTNAYSVLDRLVDIGLAKKDETQKKIGYLPSNPSNLETYAKAERLKAMEREKSANELIPKLSSLYFKQDYEPGIRYYRGKKELSKIYDDQVANGETIYFIQSPKDFEYYDVAFMQKIRTAASKKGVKRVGLCPDRQNIVHSKAADEKNLLNRTWMSLDDYTAPVEWGVYGDKISVISLGKEGVGMIIDSPQIAESMRQIFRLAQAGATALYPDPKFGYKKEYWPDGPWNADPINKDLSPKFKN